MGYSARQNVGCAPHRGSGRRAGPGSLTLKVGRHRVPEAHLTDSVCPTLGTQLSTFQVVFFLIDFCLYFCEHACVSVVPKLGAKEQLVRICYFLLPCL